MSPDGPDDADGRALRDEILGALGLAEAQQLALLPAPDGSDDTPAAKRPTPDPSLGLETNEGPVAQLVALLPELTIEQLRYMIARQSSRTIKAAAEAVGISPRTVRRWPARVRRAPQLMAQAGALVALHLRQRHVAEAMQVKIDGLRSEDERVRQTVATQIIEWELGKATRPDAANRHSRAPEVADARQRLERLIARHAGSDDPPADSGEPQR